MDTLSFLHKRKMKELKGQDRNDYLLNKRPRGLNADVFSFKFTVISSVSV